MQRKYWIAALAFVVAIGTPQVVQAQDCGSSCGFCATGKKEGYTYHANGDYNMDCLTATTGCATCGGAVELVKDAAGTPGAVLKAIRTLPMSELARLAPTLKGKLLVHPERNIVAMKGEACAENTVIALTFLSRERMDVLVRSGLPELKGFLDQAVKPTQ